jgi:hypothetical protein
MCLYGHWHMELPSSECILGSPFLTTKKFKNNRVSSELRPASGRVRNWRLTVKAHHCKELMATPQSLTPRKA